MNRLWVRLTLAFVGVTLIGVLMVTLLVDWQAGSEFRQYLVRQNMMNQSGVLDDLVALYQRQGDWNGVADIFAASRPGRGRGLMSGRPVLLLVDANSRIVYDEQGTRLNETISPGERANALPVTVNGQVVGYLLVSTPGRSGSSLNTAEQAFLDQLRSTLIVAALIAGGVGILLGLVISHTLANPLAHVAQTARAFAARDWNRRALVGGPSEVADVARAFNEMTDGLQQAEVQRRNLMADIAHDLRTPLTVMQGTLQALLDGVYPLDSAEVASLYDETRLLGRLVDDIRELALADAGQLSLKLQSVDPDRVIRTTAANLALAADAQNVEIGLDIASDLPNIRADADRLAQVLRNLLTNALRHAAGSRVTITGRLQSPSAGNRRTVYIAVSDTGEGIPTDDLPHVFDRFYRGDKSRSRGGSGLGLAIAKTWIEAMHGELAVESNPGYGSRFWFTLPIAGDENPGVPALKDN